MKDFRIVSIIFIAIFGLGFFVFTAADDKYSFKTVSQFHELNKTSSDILKLERGVMAPVC